MHPRSPSGMTPRASSMIAGEPARDQTGARRCVPIMPCLVKEAREGRMLLGIDGGITNAVFGLFAGDASETTAIWRLTSPRARTADAWYALLAPLFVAGGLRPDSVDAVVLSSVVPAIGDALIRTARERFGVEPLVVGPALDLGITVRTDVPNETGTDRITNCAAAFARFGGPTIVVDLGTATKIEA